MGDVKVGDLAIERRVDIAEAAHLVEGLHDRQLQLLGSFLGTVPVPVQTAGALEVHTLQPTHDDSHTPDQSSGQTGGRPCGDQSDGFAAE